MTSGWELAANIVNAASILLATLNSRHTWWTGILGCVLFGWVFLTTQLYADATLQLFFIITSVIGWWNWTKGDAGKALPVRRTPLPVGSGWCRLPHEAIPVRARRGEILSTASGS